MEQYAIVEFMDGLQMIPSAWITENSKYAYWPTFTSNEKFKKAVQKCISKMDDWSQHEIKRILATASTYEKGIKKLKKAEFISDLNSESEDNDTLKKSRKYRAKTIISSEESFSEEENVVRVPLYPKVPNKKIVTQSHEERNAAIKIPLKNKNISNLTKYENNNSNIKPNKTSVETFCSAINNNTEHDFNQNVKEKDIRSPKTDSKNISTTDFQQYVIRKLLDINFKISTIHEEQKSMSTKLDSVQNQIQTFVLDDGVRKQVVEVDYMELFPLQKLEDLEKLEQQLIENKINRKALITQVARIGGTDIKSITFNILRRLLSDSIGSLFSYVGGKKKRSFFDLYLRKIIFGAVRVFFPEATEQKISEPIKSWLRHATERDMKKKNTIERAETIFVLQEYDDQTEETDPILNEQIGPNRHI